MTLTVAATGGTTAPPSLLLLILLALFVLVVALGYGMACWAKPFTHCHRCKGAGTSPRRLADRLRHHSARPARAARGNPPCPRCGGTGLRLRLGRRAANHLIHTHRRST